jgi:Flp pilus assembly protein CpaB
MFESKKRAFFFMILAILFALAAVLLFTNYVSDMEQSLGELVEIQVAKQDIPAGSPIGVDMLTSIQIPKKYAVDSFVTSPGELAGKISLVPIPKDEVLTKAMLRETSNTPSGYRLVQLRAPMAIFDEQLDVLDRVDLIGTYESKEGKEADTRRTEVMLKDVQVIRVYKKEEEIVSIGVALSLADAQKVIWLMNYGKELRVLKTNNHLLQSGGKE